MKRAATAAEKRHLDRVAKLPCAICGAWPVHVHHIREGFGMGQRAPHALTLPLCPEHHQGTDGVHGSKACLRLIKKSELDLLAETILKLEAMK